MKVVLSVARIARWLSYAAAFATALLLFALYDEDWKIGVAVLAAVPAVVLFLFSTALAEAAALPARLRNAPSEAAELQTFAGPALARPARTLAAGRSGAPAARRQGRASSSRRGRRSCRS